MTSYARALRCGWLLAALLFSWTAGVLAEEDLTVLSETPDGVAPGKQFEVYLKEQMYRLVDRRLEAYEAVKTLADCQKWQDDRREFFLRQLDGFPERTPLEAKVVGRLEGKGYRMEKVVFQSRPNFHVTANLYLPTSKPPYPAVLVPCGHSHNGKASGQYQRISILLAKHGIAALCYDPISQGERYQMLDFEKEHTHFRTAKWLEVPHPQVQFVCTIEHTTAGLGCILLGSNLAQYRIWDGMRAIDYLQSRKDIIGDKIGCTGNSGGGTLTSYIMALDDRVVAAAPGGFLMTYRRLIDTKGAQDAEQCIFAQIAFGMDEADYVIMRAPRATLICASTHDKTFPIDGTWPLFREAKRFYSRLRYPERVELVEADAPHGFTIQTREAAVQWMRRWLLGIDDTVREIDKLPEPLDHKTIWKLSEGDWENKDLQCTVEGQVLLLPGEKSVFQLNAEKEARLREKRTARWSKLTDAQRRDLVRETIGCGKGAAEKPECSVAGTIKREGYMIEKLVITPEAGVRLPALAFIPAKPNGQACLYLHGESMKADAGPGGPIKALVKRGQIVLAAELRGIGETEPGHDKRDYGRGQFGRDVQEIFLAYLIGRSYVGMRSEDVATLARFLARYKTVGDKPNELHLVAIGEAAIPALHAAALEPERFASVRLLNMIPSWADIVRTPENLNQAASVVHGALKNYDLPDLIDMINLADTAGSKKVRVEEPLDVNGNPVAAK